MNDVEIKDIDKLKNLLIEFGVEFHEDSLGVVDRVIISASDHDCLFKFKGDKFIDFWVA